MDDEIRDLQTTQKYIAYRLTVPLKSDQDEMLGFASPCKLREQDLAASRETLVRKRLSQTRHLLPNTAWILADTFDSTFRSYADQNHVNGTNAIVRDALEFATWLERQRLPVDWVGQFATWESSRHLGYAGWCVKLIRFDWIFDRETSNSQSPKRKRNYLFVFRLGKYRVHYPIPRLW